MVEDSVCPTEQTQRKPNFTMEPAVTSDVFKNLLTQTETHRFNSRNKTEPRYIRKIKYQ